MAKGLKEAQITSKIRGCGEEALCMTDRKK